MGLKSLFRRNKKNLSVKNGDKDKTGKTSKIKKKTIKSNASVGTDVVFVPYEKPNVTKKEQPEEEGRVHMAAMQVGGFISDGVENTLEKMNCCSPVPTE
mmetsp:Transcript_44932/g.66101  ORF Transcript_44932/g.66101 Transcript_44932/m.66101 type:complete len:99 (+) Transcript_44932:51-347(+)|eukprot:CAMPEP_0195524564 /NCGR_PEP_ID=MMETSP0794_2-20130614/24477_1 /TAXON_ID=515487 /ORGANISM="Stephanopyxis turris, Strain CCMP 815" /LENGTH=98 /DNA_ID=CAMNT_0040654813 /DNA_START=44 /DNA_END=340 /DNA_ORIENTATION=-